MDKSGAGAGFLRELRFSLPIYIQSASPQSSTLSLEAGTIGQEFQSDMKHSFVNLLVKAPLNKTRKKLWLTFQMVEIVENTLKLSLTVNINSTFW
jgi:hypothetical protein